MSVKLIRTGDRFIIYSRHHLGCFGSRDRGTCTNKLTIAREEVEARVLHALQDKLMRKDFFEEFCREFTKEMNRLRMEQRAGLTSVKREIERIGPRIKKLLDLLLDDAIVSTPEKGQFRIELQGNLAAMLTVAQQTKRSPETGDLFMPVQMVAGARNQRYLQLWSGAA